METTEIKDLQEAEVAVPAVEAAPATEEKTEAELEAITEAALFVAGHPLTYEKLANVLGMMPGKVRKFVRAFAERYNAPEHNRGMELVVMDGQCQLCTKANLSQYVKSALGMRKTAGGLSTSCMEVLAIIAYQQPITKGQLEQQRGLDSSYQINTLLERRLIKRHGRLDVPGRPILYVTAPAFLRCFGITSLTELPKIDISGITPETEQADIIPDDIPLDENGNPIDPDAEYDPVGMEYPEEEAEKKPIAPTQLELPLDEEPPAEPDPAPEADEDAELEVTDVDDFLEDAGSDESTDEE